MLFQVWNLVFAVNMDKESYFHITPKPTNKTMETNNHRLLGTKNHTKTIVPIVAATIPPEDLAITRPIKTIGINQIHLLRKKAGNERARNAPAWLELAKNPTQ